MPETLDGDLMTVRFRSRLMRKAEKQLFLSGDHISPSQVVGAGPPRHDPASAHAGTV